MRLLYVFGIGAVMMAVGGLGKAGVFASSNPIEAKARKDEIFTVRTGDPAMEAARAKGQATLDGFLAVYDRKPPTARAFSIKVPVRDGEAVEWFWIKDFTRDGDRFRGAIDNTPRVVKTVRSGERIDFPRSAVADWMYVQDGNMKGNFTACALLAKEEPKARDEFIRKFGMDCSA